MTHQTTTPKYWPGTRIVKSQAYPFAWRVPGTDPRPLNVGVQATTAPERRGPKTAGGIAAKNGTIHGLSPRAEKLLAPRPDHVGFVIPQPSAASKQSRPMVPSHAHRPTAAQRKQAAA